jgi:predicted HicB family RNase H-like nuclease
LSGKRPWSGLSWQEFSVETSVMTKGPEKRDRKLSLRLSSTTLERLRTVAKVDKRSMSDWALLAVEEAIDRAEAKRARAKAKAE